MHADNFRQGNVLAWKLKSVHGIGISKRIWPRRASFLRGALINTFGFCVTLLNELDNPEE